MRVRVSALWPFLLIVIALTLPSPVLSPAYAELIVNPSFEFEDGWDKAECMTAEQARTGRRSLKLDTSELPLVETHFTRLQAWSDFVALEPEMWYRISVWVKAPTGFRTGKGEPRGAHVGFPAFDKDKTALVREWTIAGETDVTFGKATGEQWVEMAKTFRTPPGTAFGRVRLGMADNGVAYFDDLKLEKLGKESPLGKLPPCTITERP
ncbi:MAG: hypothetical protein FJ279_25040, partial [Planctomycetes bacterium]|nr:hypothetical protein [Planctomycetota bacterium]